MGDRDGREEGDGRKEVGVTGNRKASEEVIDFLFKKKKCIPLLPISPPLPQGVSRVYIF